MVLSIIYICICCYKNSRNRMKPIIGIMIAGLKAIYSTSIYIYLFVLSSCMNTIYMKLKVIIDACLIFC